MRMGLSLFSTHQPVPAVASFAPVAKSHKGGGGGRFIPMKCSVPFRNGSGTIPERFASNTKEVSWLLHSLCMHFTPRHKVHFEQRFFKKLHWLLISLSLHISGRLFTSLQQFFPFLGFLDHVIEHHRVRFEQSSS